MKKDLNHLSTEELGKLFPIIISDYNPQWKTLFQLEKEKIVRSLGNDSILCIEHIGSTAIPKLKAKPTIDILIEMKKDSNIDNIRKELHKLDYQYIHKPENPPPHMMFAKGYTINGFAGQAFHIHLRYKGDCDEKLFRDFLLKNPYIAKEYEEVKVHLAQKYKNDREAYTEGKSEFIKNIINLAKSQ